MHGVTTKISMYVYVCTYIRMYVRVYVCMCVCMYVRMYVCMYVSMYVCMYLFFFLIASCYDLTPLVCPTSEVSIENMAQHYRYVSGTCWVKGLACRKRHTCRQGKYRCPGHTCSWLERSLHKVLERPKTANNICCSCRDNGVKSGKVHRPLFLGCSHFCLFVAIEWKEAYVKQRKIFWLTFCSRLFWHKWFISIQNKLLCLFGITFIIGYAEYIPVQKPCAPPIPPFCAVDYINCIYFADIAMLYNISEKKTLHFVGL